MNAISTWILRVTAGALLLGLVHAQTQPLSQDRVTFFTEPNFKGEALTVEAGASVENLEQLLRPSQRPWLYAISSVRIEGAARATVFSAAGFRGDRLEIGQSITDLRRSSAAAGRRDGAATDDRRGGPGSASTAAPTTCRGTRGPATPRSSHRRNNRAAGLPRSAEPSGRPRWPAHLSPPANARRLDRAAGD
jgi:hypothetical protein